MMHPQIKQNATNVTTLFVSGGGFCRWAGKSSTLTIGLSTMLKQFNFMISYKYYNLYFIHVTTFTYSNL